MFRFISIVLIFMQLSACAVYPKFDKEASPQCDVFSKQFTLDMAIDDETCTKANNGGELLLCLGLSGVLFTATAVISGSIVIVGNTVHFLEQQGRCENSYIRRTLDKHLSHLDD